MEVLSTELACEHHLQLATSLEFSKIVGELDAPEQLHNGLVFDGDHLAEKRDVFIDQFGQDGR